MKNTIIENTNTEQQGIDWDAPMWGTFEDLIVLTTGEHSKISFTGTCLPCKSYDNGHYMGDWNKSCFTPLKRALTITISN